MRHKPRKIKAHVFHGTPKTQRRLLWFDQSIDFSPIQKRAGKTLRLLFKQARRLKSKTGLAFKKVLTYKKGNRLSRLLRIIFEARLIKTIIGTFLPVVFLLSIFTVNSVGGSFGLVGGWRGERDGTNEVFVTEKGVRSPLGAININQRFSFIHKGVDLDGNTGDPVRPVAEGVVKKVNSWNFAYGKHVIVDHGSGFVTIYAHLSQINVKEGERVTIESTIGKVGSTGWSTGPHLHLEFWVNGEAVDPLIYLGQQTLFGAGEKENKSGNGHETEEGQKRVPVTRVSVFEA